MNFLFRSQNNAALILFRIFFGLLMFLESWGAIATGWVHETLVEPSFTFTFIGFEWTQFMLGNFMYLYYIIMGFFGLGIMLGYRYVYSCIGFALMWSLTYFMQKSHYNNHYYLVMLFSWMMALVPANRRYSLDLKQGRVLFSNTCSYWACLIFMLQIAIVYFYGALQKVYPDWLDAEPIKIWFTYKSQWVADICGDDFFFVELMKNRKFHFFIAYMGIAYDLLIIPFLLSKRTRTLALIGSLCFHLFNSIIFQVGIFPYFALSLSIFFYPPERIEALFFRTKTKVKSFQPTKISLQQKGFIFLGIAYFIWQFALPMRHWLIPSNVFWTEEGHRLSWRMMLRSRQGYAIFFITSDKNPQRIRINTNDYLTDNQIRSLSKKPDMMWQFAQYIKKLELEKGNTNVQIFVQSFNSLNHRPQVPFTDKEVDIANIPWNTFGHQSWILDPPEGYMFDFRLF